jgi:hypothetical protein
MSIFKRSSGDAQQTTAAPPLVPPGAAPGVVPPRSAPMYSTRPPDSAGRVEGYPGNSVAENVRMARDAQLKARASVQAGVRGAVARTKTPACPAPGVQMRPAPAQPRARPPFAADCAQAALLNLAWSWQEAGAPIRAIHAYVELLHRYPDTDAADAAVADLMELTGKLAAEGQFHTALGIFEQLEELI